MEFFPKKELKTDLSEINYINESKRKSSYNYFTNFPKNRLSIQKRANSMIIFNNKNSKLAIKYNFNDDSIYNECKRVKTFVIKEEKNNNEYKYLKDYYRCRNIKKRITFDKKKMNIQFSDNKIKVIKNNLKKLNNDYDQLPIPLKSKHEFKKGDFEVISLSGRGAYGTVLQVKLKEPNSELENKNKTKDKYYAIKVMDIESMKRVNKLYQVYLESQILNELNNPLIVQIYGTFQSKAKVYMVLDYLSKGDFATFLKMNYPLKEETIRFYAAEIVLFLEYLQNQKIVHRDLKPNNIMLNDNNHLQIIDFATVRKIGYYYDKKEMKFREDNFDLENDDEDIKGEKVIINPDGEDDDDDIEEEKKEEENCNVRKLPPRNKTFVGTAEYVSPEVIGDQPAGYGADLWAFGIMLYEMFCGRTPFKGENTYVTFKNIEKLEISFPKKISISENAKDLIKKILIKDPSKRLGAGEPKTELDIEHLKNHSFFKGIKWKNIYTQNVPNSKLFKFISNKKVIRKSIDNSKKDEKNDNNENVIIIKKGSLYKKSFWFHYNERIVILDNTPRITYKEPDKDAIKGIIDLNKKCKVYISRQDIFVLDTPKGEYKFKSKKNDVALWINTIKDCIKKYGKEE